MKINLYQFLKPVISFLFKLIYRPVIINKDNIPKEGSVILAGNHIHAFDPLFVGICTRRTIHFLAKKELYRGLNFIFFNLVGTLPVDTHNKNKNTIGQAEKILNENGVIGIFPEGTRNRTEKKLLDFKKGAVNFAKNTNSLIVPFSITGKYKFLNGNLTINIGKPYKLESSNLEKENEILKSKISMLIDESTK